MTAIVAGILEDDGLLDPDAPVPHYVPELGASFLSSLKKGSDDHGGPFRYASPNSDVLGLVIERASGRRFADLAAARLWQPLGARQDAYITVDAAGSARTGGGLNMTPRDIARIGELMRQGGTVDGRRIVSAAWVHDTTAKWYQTGSGAFFAIGIHGQWLYVDPRAEMVVAKFSSQPMPVDNEMKRLKLALSGALAGIT